MLRRTSSAAAKVYGVPWAAGRMQDGHVGTSTYAHQAKQREGMISTVSQNTDTKMRRSLNDVLMMSSSASAGQSGATGRKLTTLPGVEHASELPADPLTRIFFQTKGDHALYQGTFDNPSSSDPDRVKIEKRRCQTRKEWKQLVRSPMFDFCHRIREAQELRKRFVVVPSTHETKGSAEVLLAWGMVAGFRDFHNDRAFAVELKYFQNEPVIQVIEPASIDLKVEFEWSPKMVRRFSNQYGLTNRMQLYVMRTHDGRVIDHVQAQHEHIGGRGLFTAH